MSIRRLLVLALPLGAALVAAGVATAHNGPPTVQATATFSTTAITHKQSATCTAANGDTLYFTNAVYTGTAGSSDPRLNGSLVIRARSFFDAETQSGVLVGKFRIQGMAGAGAKGRLEATVTSDQAVGGIRGEVDGPSGKLLASWSSTFGPFTGFSNGALDTTSPTWAKVRISKDVCAVPPTQIYTEGGGGGHHHHHHHHHHHRRHHHRRHHRH